MNRKKKGKRIIKDFLCSKSIENKDNDEIKNLFKERSYNYQDYIYEGFNKYIFKNKREQYYQIKILCFLIFINYSSYKNDIEGYFIISSQIKKISNYLDKIKIIISFTRNFMVGEYYKRI